MSVLPTAPPKKFYRISDLCRMGLVPNRVTLRRWVIRGDFPPGRRLGPRIVAWDAAEIAEWMRTRPKAVPTGKDVPT